MKRRIRILVLAALLGAALGQPVPAGAPGNISFQGKITDAGGQQLASGDYRIEFSICEGPNDGAACPWTESHDPVTVTDGYASVVLGGGAGTLNGVITKEHLYLGIKTGPPGGPVGGEILPRQQLLSAPFSRQSDSAARLHEQVRTATSGANAPKLELLAATNFNMELRALSEDFGQLRLLNNQNNARGTIYVEPADSQGVLRLRGPNGMLNVVMAGHGGNADRGTVNVLDASEVIRAELAVSSDSGFLNALGPNGMLNVVMDTNSTGGKVEVRDAGGVTRARMSVLSTLEGALYVYGPNGMVNVVSQRGANANVGYLEVYDSAAVGKARLSVDNANMGSVFGDTKQFVVEHPTRPGHRIVYVSREGPEGAMFWRGRAQLVDGRATLELPEHFHVLSIPETITVDVTPHSFESRGLGVESIAEDRIEVAELFDGEGSYEISFMIQATRRDHADHRPVVSDADYYARYGGQPSSPATTDAGQPTDLQATGGR
ncbi:MAG: hypothetical protein GY716_25585 [bacterium]|nr:hypothetical protein [bacterium]